MWKALIRPGMIFLAFALGFACPAAHQLNWLIRWLLVGMLYMVCLQLKFRELKLKRSHFKLLAANLLMGIVPYFLLHWAGREDWALAAFFVGITPTANAAPVVMGFLHGRVGYVVTAFVLLNLGVSLALLLLLPLVTGQFSWHFVGTVGDSLLFIIGLPVALAVITRLFWRKAKEWPAKCRNLSFGAWSCALFIIAADASFFFHGNPHLSWTLLLGIAVISLLICLANFIGGYWLGSKYLRRESSQSLGQKNTMFTLFLALTFANPLVAMGPTFYVLWHNIWNALQMFLYDRRRAKRQALLKVK